MKASGEHCAVAWTLEATHLARAAIPTEEEVEKSPKAYLVHSPVDYRLLM